jgi:hypothetical protein
MLQPQVEKRFDSATVCTELQKIFERCQADKSYAVNDCSVALSSTTNWIMQEPEVTSIHIVKSNRALTVILGVQQFQNRRD